MRLTRGMPQRERLYAIFRLFGYLNRVREEVASEVENTLGQLMLEDLYRFRVKKEDAEELIEGIKRSMGLSDDDELVRLLRNASSRDRSG